MAYGYDGAANMSEQFKGVKSYIHTKYRKTLYMHYVTHSLNLTVSSACDLQPIQTALELLKNILFFQYT